MKTIIALAVAAIFVSGSAFAQEKKYEEVTREQSQATAQANATAKAPEAKQQVAPTVDVQAIAQKKLGDWQQKKQECFIAAGLTKDVHFRQNPADPSNFQVKESVYFTPGFNVPAIRKCVTLQLTAN